MKRAIRAANPRSYCCLKRFHSGTPQCGDRVKGLIMPKDKDRSGRNSENDRGRNVHQRMWSPSHKIGRGGGNRK
jgi:hypothetical protein